MSDGTTSEPAPTPRYEWGPDITDQYPGPEAPPQLADVQLTFVSHDPATGNVVVEKPENDPATSVSPRAVHLILYPPGAAQHALASDAMADQSLPKSSAALVGESAAESVTLGRPANAEPGVIYTAKTISEFAA